jgi:hypothetical protein
MYNLNQLTLDSTLGDLPASDLRVKPDVPVKEIAKAFEHQADLLGIMVVNKKQLLSMISRRKYLEYMSRPFTQDLFMKKPVSGFLEHI